MMHENLPEARLQLPSLAPWPR